jgi:tetratricopeptide (TPR) repeat protein
MTKKKIIILITAIVIILAASGAAWYFLSPSQAESNKLNEIKKTYPELAEFTDDIVKEQTKMKTDESRMESYFSLGLAWKSLADRANDRKLNDTSYYYQKALETYQKGIEVTKHKNPTLMMNAADMEIYLKNYAPAEDYYKEAISVMPGQAAYYVALADLYESYMNKSKEEIIAVFDEGLTRVIGENNTNLQIYKDRYLKRISEVK